MILPEPKSKIGHKGKLTVPPNDEQVEFEIIDEIRKPQSNFPEKISCLQKLRFKDGRDELRLGYYIVSKSPNKKWVWSRYTLMLPKEDFLALFHEAEKQGWFRE